MTTGAGASSGPCTQVVRGMPNPSTLPSAPLFDPYVDILHKLAIKVCPTNLIAIAIELDGATLELRWAPRPLVYEDMGSMMLGRLRQLVEADKRRHIFAFYAVIDGCCYTVDESNYASLPSRAGLRFVATDQMVLPSPAFFDRVLLMPRPASLDPLPRYVAPDPDNEPVEAEDTATLLSEGLFTATPPFRCLASDLGLPTLPQEVRRPSFATALSVSPPPSTPKRLSVATCPDVQTERGTIAPPVSPQDGAFLRLSATERFSAPGRLQRIWDKPASPGESTERVGDDLEVGNTFGSSKAPPERTRHTSPRPQWSAVPPDSESVAEANSARPLASATVDDVIDRQNSGIERTAEGDSPSNEAELGFEDYETFVFSETPAPGDESTETPVVMDTGFRLRKPPIVLNTALESDGNYVKVSRWPSQKVRPLAPINPDRIVERCAYAFYADDSDQSTASTDTESYVGSSRSGGDAVDPEFRRTWSTVRRESPYVDQTGRSRSSRASSADVSELSVGLPRETAEGPRSLFYDPDRSQESQYDSVISSHCSDNSHWAPTHAELSDPGERLNDRSISHRWIHGLRGHSGARPTVIDLLPSPSYSRKHLQKRICDFRYRDYSFSCQTPNSHDEAVHVIRAVWQFAVGLRFMFFYFVSEATDGGPKARMYPVLDSDWPFVPDCSYVWVSIINDDVPSPSMWCQAVLDGFRTQWTDATVANDPTVRRIARRQARRRRRRAQRKALHKGNSFSASFPLVPGTPRGSISTQLLIARAIESTARAPSDGSMLLGKRCRSNSPSTSAPKREHLTQKRRLRGATKVSGSPVVQLQQPNKDDPRGLEDCYDGPFREARRLEKGKFARVLNSPDADAAFEPIATAKGRVAPPHSGLYIPQLPSWSAEGRQLVRERLNAARRRRKLQNQKSARRVATGSSASVCANETETQVECRASFIRATDWALDNESDCERSAAPPHDDLGYVLPHPEPGDLPIPFTDRRVRQRLEREAVLEAEASGKEQLLKTKLNSSRPLLGRAGAANWARTLARPPVVSDANIRFNPLGFFRSACPVDHDLIPPLSVSLNTSTRSLLHQAVEVYFPKCCILCAYQNYGVPFARRRPHDVLWGAQLLLDSRPITKDTDIGSLGAGLDIEFSLLTRPVKVIPPGDLYVEVGWQPEVASNQPPRDGASLIKPFEHNEAYGGILEWLQREDGNAPVHASEVVPLEAPRATGATVNHFVGGIPWQYEREPTPAL